MERELLRPQTRAYHVFSKEDRLAPSRRAFIERMHSVRHSLKDGHPVEGTPFQQRRRIRERVAVDMREYLRGPRLRGAQLS